MKPLERILTTSQYLVLLIFLAVIGIPAGNTCGQGKRTASEQKPTEDQLIAEALWAMVDAYPESIESDRAKEAFAAASDAFPDSARVAYWRGKCGLFQAGMTRVLHQLVEVADSLSDPELEASTDDPVVKRKFQASRAYARDIRERIQERLDESTETDHQAAAELALLKAVQLEPAFVAGWVGLLESSDASVAVSAAEAWAEIEPDNALPLYAKAVVLTRGHLRSGAPAEQQAIEAIEAGNRRPNCVAPDLPWPTDFSLTFPDAWDDELQGLAGKRVPEAVFRKSVESLFFQVEAVGTASTISESAMREFGDVILRTSHRHSVDEDVRQLRAFVGCGLHLADSNRLLYALTMGSVWRHLNRLETIAVDQRDFESARSYRRIQEYLAETRRLVAEGYDANKQENSSDHDSDVEALLSAKLPQEDENATRVMQERATQFEVPEIEINSERPPGPAIIGTDASSEDLHMVRLDLVYSKDGRVHMHQRGEEFDDWLRDEAQRPLKSRAGSPAQALPSDELVSLGVPRLDDRIAAIRRENRQQGRSLGLFLFFSDRYVGQDVAGLCYTSGYVGKRDPCVLAFRTAEALEEFQEWYGSSLRKVQMLGPGPSLTEGDLQAIAPNADGVAVPADRLIAADGEILPVIRQTDLQIYAVTAEGSGSQEREAFRNRGSVAGIILRQDGGAAKAGQ